MAQLVEQSLATPKIRGSKDLYCDGCRKAEAIPLLGDLVSGRLTKVDLDRSSKILVILLDSF